MKKTLIWLRQHIPFILTPPGQWQIFKLTPLLEQLNLTDRSQIISYTIHENAGMKQTHNNAATKQAPKTIQQTNF